MAGITYIGNGSGKSEKLTKGYIGDSNDKSKTIQKIYVGNSSNKSVRVWPIPILPLAYQQVEYIYNTNRTEYINTGVNPDSNTRCWMDVFVLETVGSLTYAGDCAGFMGTSNGTTKYSVDIYGGGTKYREYCSILFGTSYAVEKGYYDSPYFRNLRHTIEVNRSGGYMYIDDVEYGPSTATFSSIGKPIFLFVKNNNGTPGFVTSPYYGGKFYLYHFMAWQGNTLIRDMYPCYKKSDLNAVGMYDVVNNTFYPNAGTGIFYKGPDVS